MAKWFNKQSFLVQLILVLIPFTNWILGGLYRIDKGRLIFGVIWLLTGGLFFIGWLIDVVTFLMNKKITFLA